MVRTYCLALPEDLSSVPSTTSGGSQIPVIPGLGAPASSSVLYGQYSCAHTPKQIEKYITKHKKSFEKGILSLLHTLVLSGGQVGWW